MSKRTPDLKLTKQTLLHSSDLLGLPGNESIPPRMLVLAKRLQAALQQHSEQAPTDNRKSRSKKGR
ncbi:MAG: hypothetical protein E5Y88_01890 [Mesorhizobium sp.]|uniref:hypothetical protein n=1 Tax=Mesorhizobium TaxID=68287 RepID=UPI000F74D02B|nr:MULTISPECIES: hypothetical protein [Mesorhizobium]AZO63678.1 hypothetical protein EJ075_01055 [Mesorhizobium sp. M6A.T.Cr.TU.016.01.1.1]RUU31522.1 hypothetical protein EOC94_05175 [Mesorhizobium sp. M6A.T.Ce.TU.016.01.1.1]RUU95928.1 hypothetical protein EOB36_31275 [Mesorhizobium sp. M6A.T.Cr.TU.017.01.1.1]RVB80337.1 hypothetical protein EN885_00045 [Mesorhizobium sp. M6A.T.Cr.TU.014.01.1.1]RWN37119.1 MAG: hypothetical protein EOR95_06770 [Mesorhizobium sp.]